MKAPRTEYGRHWRAVQAIFLLAVTAAAVWLGIAVRKQVWDRTEALRYVPDMKNSWNWGSRAAREGYVGLYDRVVAEKASNDLGLDYSPLRLAVLTLWAKSRLQHNPPPTEWQRDYAFNVPLLHFNMAMELLAGLAIFLLGRQWSRNDDLRRGIVRHWLRAEWLAIAAFALLWFNPAVLLSAHARITWDIWIVPFYLWAIYLCGRDFWFTAGCVLAIGVMFKAQQLIAAPVFLLWPLMRFRIGAIVRFMIGFGFVAGLIVSPWIVGCHVKSIALVAVGLVISPLLWLMLGRWPIRDWRTRLRWLRWTIPFCTAAAMWLCVPLAGGSMNWYRVAVIYGANKFNGLEIGGATSLTAILQHDYGWKNTSPLQWLTIFGHTFTLFDLLVASYGLMLIPICWAMSRYDRAGDKRFVLAMAAPWIFYFAVFPKIHERYLLWGACAACASTIVGMGPVWLALLLSALQTMMSLFQMLRGDRAREFLTEISSNAGRYVHDFIAPTYPGIGWATMLATAVWIWLSVAGAIKPLPTAMRENPNPPEG